MRWDGWVRAEGDCAIETVNLVIASASGSIWASNLLSPPVLFFVVGLAAVAVKSDLALPEPFKKVLGYYLLFSIGFKGGAMLRESGVSNQGLMAMAIAVGLSAVTPLWLFPLLRKRLGGATAGGVAAAYGSVSAVTFMAAITMLRDQGVEYGGHMVAAMALMEFPSLIVGVLLGRMGMAREGRPPVGATAAASAPDEAGLRGVGLTVDASEAAVHAAAREAHGSRGPGLGEAIREAASSGPIVLLIGSMLVGGITTDEGRRITSPMWSELFSGLLCFYLLDLGMVAGRGIRDIVRAGVAAVVVGLLFPPVNAALALLICKGVGLDRGDTFLMMVMAGSASYIAAPAALRIALPEARAGVYVPMALSLTFPLNIIVGLPVYWKLAGWVGS